MKEQVLKVIRDRIGELLVKNKWPLLDVTSGAYTEEIEKDVLAGLDDHVETYGIRSCAWATSSSTSTRRTAPTSSVSTPTRPTCAPSVGVERYQQFAAGKAMMGAGEGMAQGGGTGGAGGTGGGGASGLLGGAGLGVGFGLAQMLVRDPRGGEALAPVDARFCGQCGQGRKG